MRRVGRVLAAVPLTGTALTGCGGSAGAEDNGQASSVTLRVGATGWKREAAVHAPQEDIALLAVGSRALEAAG
ncbi:hypothetical protein [Streptomyces sp. F001]|uniref:hypothetical protein n=1 Tax=Streptomyces sp. F001 TaxID=1510026 RepID=UPI0019D1B72F|nr:hypothetical protein [Streptomyces sp. F001]